MRRSPWRRSLQQVSGAFLLFLLLAASFSASGAEEQTERRMQLGLKLFPAIVAADLDLITKSDANSRLHIALLYRDDRDAAEKAAQRLRASGRIKNLPVELLLLPYARLDELSGDPPAALFLAEWVPDELPRVVRFGTEQHRLVFSPFKGDVAAGIQTGIFISDRILPLVNPQALQDAAIRLKPFLLEVARTNE